MKIYLAHSVHERDRGIKAQRKLEELGYEVFNPFYPDDVIRSDIEAIDRGDIMAWDIADKPKSLDITERDLEGLRKQDIVVCLYPDGRTVGIPCEMFFAAHVLNMPVYSVVPKDMIGHPWIVRYSKAIFTADDDVIDYLRR